MTKQHNYLKLRGKTYAIRVPVLKELQAIIGKTEITRSLKTRDLNQANIRYPEYLAVILKQFEIARAKLDDEKPAHLIGFDPFGTVHDWFRQRYSEITNQTKSEFENETLIAEFKHGLKSDLAELMSVNPERKFHMVSNLANFLLLAKGYPTSKGSGLANIDTHDPKFVLFLELLVTAQVELIEYNLSRLGEHITKTPNGRIFWQDESIWNIHS